MSAGYVARTLEAALWAFYHTTNFRDGDLLAVNLGYDTDTIAAIYGQLAGAHYGIEAIPEHWRELIVMREVVEGLAGELCVASEFIPRRLLPTPDNREKGLNTIIIVAPGLYELERP